MAGHHPDLSFETIPVGVETPPETNPRLRGWLAALHRGFHESRVDDERFEHWLSVSRADGVVLRGAWEAEPEIGEGHLPVATFCHFDKSINTGAGLLPLRMITDVTVSPAHRRRGLLRRMMTENLAEAAAHGLPLAALTVSEGSIYGRFGFGPATRGHRVEVDTTSRFALRSGMDIGDGRVVLVEPMEAVDAVAQVSRAHHAVTRGAVERPDFYRTALDATQGFDEPGPDRKLRVAVHLDGAARPDGYAAYRHVGEQEGRACVDLVDLLSTTDAAYLSLWRFLGDLDLCERVRWSRGPVDDPLPWALTDPRVVHVTAESDTLWVRVLDVPAALEGRPWGADGEVVLEVDDPLGHAAGRFRVRTENGRARVELTTSDPGVRLSAETLGSLYLGDVTTATLHSAGRLAGADGARSTWAAMAQTGPAPYNPTAF